MWHFMKCDLVWNVSAIEIMVCGESKVHGLCVWCEL
jgi:hypothetical protein